LARPLRNSKFNFKENGYEKDKKFEEPANGSFDIVSWYSRM
jgi:hypothetical protein